MGKLNALFSTTEQVQQKQQEIFNKCSKLTKSEFNTFYKTSQDESFILAMDKLKSDDIIDFTLKLSQFKSDQQQSTPQYSITTSTTSVPKCPTCGSTNIKKISGGKRWLTTGIFGLASSDVGKTMQCNSCGTKW